MQEESMNGKSGNFSLLMVIPVLILTACEPDQAEQALDYPIVPVHFTQVRIQDSFWLPRMETNRSVTIPYAIKMCEETGRIDNLRKAAGLMAGPYEGKRFNDSDVFKVMEGIAYSLASHPDPELEMFMDELIGVLAKAQEEDGYLYTARTVDPDNPAPGAGSERWVHLAGSHELYNVGHMYEAAVAYYLMTGKRDFLDIAIRNAQLLLAVFGPNKRHDTSGHQEIEIGLPKLYRITGNREYLDLARFFLDQRGRQHDSQPYPEDTIFSIYNDREHVQDHKPVLEQETAVGHAVRAMYMCAGMADVAALTGDDRYISAIKRIWENVAGKKLYITGGVGSRHEGESFGDDYELPNREAYTETCAAIGNVFWNQRMFLLTGESKYIDVMERTLYNGLISGVSFDGDRFFYQNPLESTGGYERSEWFEVSCCPVNMLRFLPSLPGYVYAKKGNTLYVNLYVQSDSELEMNGKSLQVRQETDYPWEGTVTIILEPERGMNVTLALRIPGWALGKPVPGDLYRYFESETQDYRIYINGREASGKFRDGYAVIERIWEAGDKVELRLDMTIRAVVADERVEADADKVAYERGPLVYCAEAADNDGSVFDLSVMPELLPGAVFRKDRFGGVVLLEGHAVRNEETVNLTLVPYFAWAHRGAGEMTVWMPTIQ
jgi:DUF1680 family protein